MSERPPVVYVSSPYRGNVPRNIAVARAAAKLALDTGGTPIVPHLYLPLVLDDDDPQQRGQGIEAALRLIACCDELWSFGDPTVGMQREPQEAERLGIPVVHRALPPPAPPCWRCEGTRVLVVPGELPSYVPCPECTRFRRLEGA